MAHAHHSHAHAAGRFLGWAILLNVALVVIEVAIGFYANSLALLADAAHNLTDVIALITSWGAIQIAKRPSSAHRTFGYHRVEILAALVNAVTLVVVSAMLCWEAIQRMYEPQEVQALSVIIISIFAIGLNGLTALGLWRTGKHDLNIRSAVIHMVGDAASSAGVVLIGLVIMLTGFWIVDPIGSILIAAFIIWSSWGILKESITVLIEGAPESVDMGKVEDSLRNLPAVLEVHDLHVWTIGSGRIAGTCHLVVPDQKMSDAQAVQQTASKMLRDRFGITHSTIQIEVNACETKDLYCEMEEARGCHGHHHDHAHSHGHDDGHPEDHPH